MRGGIFLALLVFVSSAQASINGRSDAACAERTAGYVATTLDKVTTLTPPQRQLMVNMVRQVAVHPGEELKIFQRGSQLVLLVTDLTPSPSIPDAHGLREAFQVVEGPGETAYAEWDAAIAVQNEKLAQGRYPWWPRFLNRFMFVGGTGVPLISGAEPFGTIHLVSTAIFAIPLAKEYVGRGLRYLIHARPIYREIRRLEAAKVDISRAVFDEVHAMVEKLKATAEPAVVVSEPFLHAYLRTALTKVGFTDQTAAYAAEPVSPHFFEAFHIHK